MITTEEKNEIGREEDREEGIAMMVMDDGEQDLAMLGTLGTTTDTGGVIVVGGLMEESGKEIAIEDGPLRAVDHPHAHLEPKGISHHQ